MNRILLIGATGTVGREVIAQLPSGVRVRAMLRNPQTTTLPPHVEVLQGDLTRPETLDESLDGIDSVFLVWTAPGTAVGPALERIVKRARRIVYLSSLYKVDHPMFQQPNLGRLVNAEIERLIAASPNQWTFLQPGMFASNALGWWASQFRAGDVIRWPYLDCPTAPIDPRDIAAVAVRALCEEGHSRAEYLLTGPESLTHYQQIETIAALLRRSVRIEEMSPEEARRELLSFFPEFVIKMLMDAWGAAMGHPAFLSSTFAGITGRPPRTFQTWAADHAAAFQA
jgi:uncharacterized protein YbjT (DUF2867 family)